jgi:hypothetical protein
MAVRNWRVTQSPVRRHESSVAKCPSWQGRTGTVRSEIAKLQYAGAHPTFLYTTEWRSAVSRQPTPVSTAGFEGDKKPENGKSGFLTRVQRTIDIGPI